MDNAIFMPEFGEDGPRGANRHHAAFPDPYLDYASTQMPRSIYDVFRWAEFLWLTYGVYRMAAQRVVRYFLTKVELLDISDEEKEKYEDFLDNDLKIMSVLATAGDNYQCYGQDFLSMYVPFRRYLRCPYCSAEKLAKDVNYKFEQGNFKGKCWNSKCGKTGTFQRVDRRSVGQDKLRIIHWKPQQMRLVYHEVTGKTEYFWEISGPFKHYIETGNRFYLENTPWEIIDAVLKKELFKFDDDVIYHLKEETLAGLNTQGWGIPMIMSNFRQVWYIQVLKRYNQAIALDYIIPLRTITPLPGTSREADPVLHMNLNSFTSKVMGILKTHRMDPTTIHTLPFPIKMDMMGAEAKNLAPVDLMDKATDEFLNSQGVPAELYRGSLQMQVAPVAIRLFERTWVHFLTELNGLLNWILTRVADLQNWEKVKGRLQPPTLADVLEDRQVRLQLAQGNQISKQTAYAPLGINIRDEIKNMMDEEAYLQEIQQKYQEDQQHKQELQQTMQQGSMGALPGMQGQPGQGMPGQTAQGDPNAQAQQGAAPQGDPNQQMAMQQQQASPVQMAQSAGGNGSTPEDLAAQAEQIAYKLLMEPYEQRKSDLLQIKKVNDTLHSLIIAKIQKIRQQAKQQGGASLLQQMTGQGGM